MKFNHKLLILALVSIRLTIATPLEPIEQQEVIDEAKTGFGHLPADLQIIILKDIATKGTQKEAIARIHSFFTGNKQLASLANDPYANAPIILELAKKYFKNDLIKAAIALNTPGSKTWLANQENLKDVKLNRTPLMVAANENKINLMQQLLQGKQDINAKDKQGNTALHYAARRGNLEAVKLLLESGANLEATNQAGFTPLLLSLRRNKPEIAKFLIGRGANLNARDKRGTTTLIEAATIKSHELVQLLLAHHVDPNLADSTGHTALIKGSYSFKPEQVAAATKIIDMLLKAGAQVNIACEHGETPLGSAALAGNAQGVQLLLDRNANVNPPAGQFTPLMAAANAGNLPIVKKLLFKGADANAVDLEGKSVLSYAMDAVNAAEIIRELLKKNLVDVNTPEGTYTPLMWAAQNSHADIVRDLLARGAEVNALDGNGFSALNWAVNVEHPNLEVVQALLNAGANPNLPPDAAGYTALLKAEWGNDPQIVRALIQAGADVNAKMQGGFTALQNAIISKHIETARELLKAPNLNPNIENDHHDTALMIAFRSVYDKIEEHAEFVKALPEIIESLLKKGANPNKLDQFGELPLIKAVFADRADLVRILLAHGADKNMKDKEGRTAAEAAELMGYKEIEELLK